MRASNVQVYEIEVCRVDPTHPKSTIFRRYREFDELLTKLSQHFASEALPQLPGKIYVPGKSHTKQVRPLGVSVPQYLHSAY